MSVLTCDRKGCKNIMCDKYSPEYGYICHECYQELSNVYPDVQIKEFMESEKGYYLNNDYSLDEIFMELP